MVDQSSHNGNLHFVESISADAPDVVIKQAFIVSQEEIELFKDDNGKKFRRIRTIRKVARRTFLSGKLRGKYWGYPSDTMNRRQDVGDFFDITIYESEVLVDKYDIKTDKQTNYKELTEAFSRKLACRSQSIHFEQFAENILVLRDHESTRRFKMDLHEPALFNPKLLHSMHQSNGTEVFGTIESHICGYLVDYVLEVEETIEEVQEIRNEHRSTEISAVNQAETGATAVENDPIGKDRKRDRNGATLWQKESIFLLLLFALALICMLARFPLAAILVAASILFLLFRRPTWGSRVPWWVFAAFALLLGLLLWDFIHSSYPPITERASYVKNWFSDRSTATIDNPGKGRAQEVADHSIKPVPDSLVNSTSDTSREQGTENLITKPITPTENPTAPGTEKVVENPKHTTPATTPPASPQQTASFEVYLNRGLKAVEEEEYQRANENFRQAAQLSPAHPRLKALAASYKATGDEKCEQFKQANARELFYIPNNYYQYAASLTQTVPLKCD